MSPISDHVSTVRIGATAAIPAILERLGVSPAEVLSEAGLDLRLFEDPDNVISFTARSHLIEMCVARTGCNYFGLLVGQQGGLSSLGLIGYLAQNSIDVKSALHSLASYFHLHARGAAITVLQESDLAFLGYAVHEQQIEAAEQLEDGAVAIEFNILRKLCGPSWKPSEVCFAHRVPRNLKPFERFFRAPLRFDAVQSGLFFPANWLRKPVQEADPELHRLLRIQVKRLDAQVGRDFPEQVRFVLRTALLTRRSSARDIAALFSMHSRTLRRRLREYDTSFQELASQTRFEMARRLLEDSESDLSQIADLLNYSDTCTFTRAFKRWSGATPAQWRKNQRKQATSWP